MYKRGISRLIALGCAAWCAVMLSRLWEPLWKKGFILEDSWVNFPTPPSVHTFIYSLTSHPFGTWYFRPVRIWLLSVSHHLFGPDPFVYSIWAAGLLIGGVLFLYFFLRSFLEANPVLLVVALGAFMMSGTHPKSLLWTCSIHNHLCFFFASGALFFRHRGWRWHSSVFFLLAIMSREAAIAWILPLMAIDYSKLEGGRTAPLRKLAKSSWELVAVPALFLAMFLYVIRLNIVSNTLEIQALTPPALAFLKYFSVFFGWNTGEYTNAENLFTLKNIFAAVFLVFLTGLALEAYLRLRPRSIFVLAACTGGILLPMVHSGLLQAEYAILLGIGVVAGVVDGAQRAWNFLSSRFFGIRGGFLEPIFFLLLGALVLPYYFSTNQSSFQYLSPIFVDRANLWKQHIAELSEANIKNRVGEVFQLEFAADMPPPLKEQALIYLPLALKEFIPGRLFVFDGEGIAHIASRNEMNFPGTAEMLEGGKFRYFLLNATGQVSELKGPL